MAFLRTGIHSVQAFLLPDGITSDGSPVAVSRAALVTWRSSNPGMLHQVYINGGFAGATHDAEQRQLVVQAPSSFQSAVRVEVIAVEPKDAHVDFACQLAPAASGNGRVKLTLRRSQTLPAEARVNVYYDAGTGQIDYTRPLNAYPIPIWPCRADKAGFGMAQFGRSDFGHDSAAAVGFGRGTFGHGQFGWDADAFTWVSPTLPLGRYRFAVTIVDPQGSEGPGSETQSIPVIPAAQPAVRLRVAALDLQTNQLTLSISDQV